MQATPEAGKVSSYWSQHEPERDAPNYYMSPVMRPYIIETAFGAEYVEKFRGNSYYAEDYFVDHFLAGREVKRMLSLCCGFGAIERRILQRLPGIESCLGLDLAEGALDTARARAHETGLRQLSYEVADLNDRDWPEAQYDLVIANGALHHLMNLEAVCAGIRRALVPGGLLLATEYVGPAYQDHAPRQLELINAAAYLVPAELRARQPLSLPFRDTAAMRFVARLRAIAARDENPAWPAWKKRAGRLLRSWLAPRENVFRFGPLHVSPKRHLLRVDPSECVRSDEIIPVLRSVFGDIRIFPFGGGILQHALDENFYDRFDAGDPLHAGTLALLCELERRLMASGQIGIENAYLLAEKR